MSVDDFSNPYIFSDQIGDIGSSDYRQHREAEINKALKGDTDNIKRNPFKSKLYLGVVTEMMSSPSISKTVVDFLKVKYNIDANFTFNKITESKKHVFDTSNDDFQEYILTFIDDNGNEYLFHICLNILTGDTQFLPFKES